MVDFHVRCGVRVDNRNHLRGTVSRDWIAHCSWLRDRVTGSQEGSWSGSKVTKQVPIPCCFSRRFRQFYSKLLSNCQSTYSEDEDNEISDGHCRLFEPQVRGTSRNGQPEGFTVQFFASRWTATCLRSIHTSRNSWPSGSNGRVEQDKAQTNRYCVSCCQAHLCESPSRTSCAQRKPRCCCLSAGLADTDSSFWHMLRASSSSRNVKVVVPIRTPINVSFALGARGFVGTVYNSEFSPRHSRPFRDTTEQYD